MMNYTQAPLEEIYQALHTNPSQGLTDQQVLRIQEKNGLNKFDKEKKETIFQKILHHLTDLTSLILFIAALISFYVALQADHSFTDPIVILAIVVIGIALAVYQESSAEKALEALEKLNAQTTVVIRGGIKQPLDSVQLVPGDILTLEAGDLIPADARIIESFHLSVDEASLTGESTPVEKSAAAIVAQKAPLGDQANMLFSSCLITEGRVTAVVVKTGMATEMGKIASLLNSTKKTKTPLQKRLNYFGRRLTIVAITAGILLFVIQLLKGESIFQIMINAVALAVAAIPEILPIIVTMTLAYGVRNMAQKNAIIRKIPAVETLGSASVICSDKTGTLTINQMTIKQIWAVGKKPLKAEEEFSDDEKHLLEMMGLASNAAIKIDNGTEKITGDPTETAIIRLLQDKNITKESLDMTFPKVFELPFDSERKLMTTIHKTADGHRYISITKGAFEQIPSDCIEACGLIAKTTHDQFAKNALRVIAVAYKYYDTLPQELTAAKLENNLTLAGFVGMIDPPRPESAAAVQAAKAAGIKTVMITGDHVLTAAAIAREVGILSAHDQAISGVDLEAMSQEDLIKNIHRYSVYARVSPKDKIRIVEAWRAHGEIIAMTGDGVNDAPALKAANVGIAMGSGTDVSQNASDIVLVDDNFASIIDAVKEGRRVFENIRKTLYSLLSGNISEVLIIILAVLFGWGMPVVAIQLLFINVVADGAPCLFISREAAEPNTMKKPPIDKNASLFVDGLTSKIAVMTTVFTVVGLIGFYIGAFITLPGLIFPSKEVGQTMAFIVIGWSSVINILNVRSNTQSIFQTGISRNKTLFFTICFSILLIAVVATVQPLMNLLHLVPVGFYHWLIMSVLAISPLIVGEIYKLFLRRKMRHASPKLVLELSQ